MKRRAIFHFLMIICITVALGCVLTSCENDEKTKEESTGRYTDKLMETIAKPDQEAVALLSLKYDLKPDVVESFLDRYLSNTDMGYKLLKDTLKSSERTASKQDEKGLLGLEKESYHQALVNASQSFGISLKTAALLVSDYRMLTVAVKGGE